jgi:hypothetical protein
MPESNKAEKKREQKANRAAGLGDADGRMIREKAAPKISQCTVCQFEIKCTKTNTELSAHASSKHNKTLDECFPDAAAKAAELIAVASVKVKGGDARGGPGDSGPTKAQRKAKAEAGLDDMLSAGLTGKKKGKK